MTPLLLFSFCSRWLILVSSMSTQSGRMALTMTWRSWCTSGSMAAGQSAVWHVEQVRTDALSMNHVSFRISLGDSSSQQFALMPLGLQGSTKSAQGLLWVVNVLGMVQTKRQFVCFFNQLYILSSWKVLFTSRVTSVLFSIFIYLALPGLCFGMWNL